MTKLGRKKLPEIAADDVARLVADLHPAASPAWTITGALSTLSGCLPREAPRP